MGDMFAVGGCDCNCNSGTCSQTFNVTGCGAALSGATVTINVSSGGTQLATGTTNGSGQVTLSWTGSCTVWVSIAKTGYTSYGQVDPLTSGGTTNVTLVIASGYGCCQCAIPTTTLHYSFTAPGCTPSSGTGTLSYSGSNIWTLDAGVFQLKCIGSQLAFWNTVVGCYEYASSFTCSPLSITIVWHEATCPGQTLPSGCAVTTWTITP